MAQRVEFIPALALHPADSFPKDPFQMEITGSRRSYLISMHSPEFYICKNVARKKNISTKDSTLFREQEEFCGNKAAVAMKLWV